jgi:archaellin
MGLKNLFMLMVFTLFSITSNAATSGNLVLTGTLAKKVEITVTPTSAASVLDLETTQTNLLVGTLTGKSNANGGYKITVASANGGKLKNTLVTSTDFLNYTLKIDFDSVSLTSPSSLDFTGKGMFTKDVNISYTGIDGFSKDEGTYSDTLTFTISAN